MPMPCERICGADRRDTDGRVVLSDPPTLASRLIECPPRADGNLKLTELWLVKLVRDNSFEIFSF